MNRSRRIPGSVKTVIALLAPLLIVTLALPGCTTSRTERVETAADYVRCSISADYEKMATLVTEDAKPYCYALAAAPQPDEPLAEIVNETWNEGSVIIEISFGGEKPYSYMRISPPTEEEPDEVFVETWNKTGDESDGTLTVAEEGGTLVITHIDGEPIEEVLAVGSGGL